ncbi:hypothetical protein F183_A14070 [Bryobacterales bacterium F-183]|nr:hypothetical protein F183_A14070 [Bryobacterales bacterium F-183]
MQVPYAHCTAITVDDSQPFHRLVTEYLDTIRSLAVGNELLTAIQNSNKRVGIAPLRPGDSGNKCVAHNATKYYRLRQALMGIRDHGGGILVPLAEELTLTLDAAEKAGHSRMFLCKQIAQGLTPATVRTINNLVHRPTGASRSEINDTAWGLAQFLEKLANGKMGPTDIPVEPAGTYRFSDLLIRLLHPWLRPGAGSNSGIYYDPRNTVSCAGDRGMAWRPPGIGLAHELCHAWRNATGQRMFDDAQACGLDDDEVMTTGIPPYQYEPFSENKFRVVWPLTNWERWRHWTNELPMRDSYR